MADANIVQTLVTSLVKQAPNNGIQDLINSVITAEAPEHADVPKGLLAGAIGGLAGVLAKTFVERLFPVRPPEARNVRRVTLSEENELSVAIDTKEWMTGLAVGTAYGAAAELSPEVTTGNGLALGSALYGLNNAGAAMSHDKVEMKPREENEAHELLSDMVYGLVVEFVRQEVRARFN